MADRWVIDLELSWGLALVLQDPLGSLSSSSSQASPKNHPVNPWDRSGLGGEGEEEFVVLTYVGGARIDALAISGPRHGDPRGRRGICTGPVAS